MTMEEKLQADARKFVLVREAPRDASSDLSGLVILDARPTRPLAEELAEKLAAQDNLPVSIFERVGTCVPVVTAKWS